MRAYKNERANELLNTGAKERNEREELELRMSTVPIKPKKFPVDGSKFKYVKPSNYSGNPLYRTTNMDYGSTVPTNFDLPSKYYPKGTRFTKEFSGGMPSDSGLQTSKPRSGVCNDFDGYLE
eukprot:TRINITY_DN1421_c0_g3_i2.p1 TRINITY_DN1421_c0_g3~~TRINITY_DN1421_c0_g3_i2.p1  ORF type:complete len:122 (+),score=19.84 TRINITY_DN1421_c0_g3_i2:73-438(+)